MSTPLSGNNGGIIPESRRPDGTIRKERKVRPGYIAPEDVAKYTNSKAESTKRPPGFVPGLGVVAPKQEEQSKNAKRNAKKREEKSGGSESMSSLKVSDAPKPNAADDTPKKPDAAEMEKKLKALKKKLRQVEETEAKGGELLPEQKEKIAKKGLIVDEINELEKALEALQV
ncbi:hypothetical protein HDV05_000030 [Chytridiales sp. JEL 0842]|nr:hypothetical protein HDV05_000030 [Chytridiales sp. JEL 0842]